MNASNEPPESRLRQLFLAALDFADPLERERFLDRACGPDHAMRVQLGELIERHRNDSFLDQPPFQIAPGSDSAVTAGHARAAESPGASGILTEPEVRRTVHYFGDYELIEEIAHGGMGVVYKARQSSLNRIVAIKMILRGQLATEADVKRFRAEAEAAANLQHPNIVAIHEVGLTDGQHYFSMDYIEGKNLAERMKESRMTAGRAAECVKQIAEAIQYAHQRGILHRDLKPQNVLIDERGQPRITDFGLAKRLEQDGSLTQTGAVMGSPSYMPPEQALGRQAEVGPASDVYSLGALLYQMLTGQPPFSGATPIDILRAVVDREPVAPSQLHGSVPADLQTICLKCLEKRPERRYHTARELAEELGRFLDQQPIFAKPASTWRKAWTWSVRNPWALIGATALAGLGLLAFAYGLWERVAYLEGKTAPAFYDPFPVGAVVFPFVLLPALLFSRSVKSRRQRNLPISNRQLAFLATAGLVLVSVGLWSDMMYIRLYVWKQPLFEKLLGLVPFLFGTPLLFCWVGGILIWQAMRGQQAYWSGALGADEEWLPRQPIHYSPGAFLAVTLLNLTGFILAAYLLLATGWFHRPPEIAGGVREETLLLMTCFVSIALTVSIACWVYATRKLYKRPLLVSVFLGALFAGSAIGWFFGPFAVPAGFAVSGILTGLGGGGLLVRWVQIKEQSAPPLAPLVLGELFQVDWRAFWISLSFVLIALGIIDVLLFREFFDLFFIPIFSLYGAFGPAFAILLRATQGKTREFFRILAVLWALGPMAMLSFLLLLPASEVGFPLTFMALGIVFGSALIYFGKIRIKTDTRSARAL